MGGFILCQAKKANKPFYLNDINLNIYTIEELCFYLCNNLYLINHSILNKELCNWIDVELEMNQLANQLVQTLSSQSLSRFVLTILSYVGFCDDDELEEIQHTLISLKDQTEEEQSKKKADNLLNNGKFEIAVREYELILRKKHRDKLGNDFYGRVHHNKGVAYARQFQFDEAAKEFLKAYDLSGHDESLKEYLCTCMFLMSDEEYMRMLEEHPEYDEASEKMKREYNMQDRQYRFIQAQKQHVYQSAESRLEEIKAEYRKTLV
ncbi:MAG: tetratricopeptide repeat protein [Clostridiales bacterium]|nr:tetratricopeptide repeat protein [Clostridiales bacterium]